LFVDRIKGFLEPYYFTIVLISDFFNFYASLATAGFPDANQIISIILGLTKEDTANEQSS
jgi:hypothetical protein